MSDSGDPAPAGGRASGAPAAGALGWLAELAALFVTTHRYPVDTFRAVLPGLARAAGAERALLRHAGEAALAQHEARLAAGDAVETEDATRLEPVRVGGALWGAVGLAGVRGEEAAGLLRGAARLLAAALERVQLEAARETTTDARFELLTDNATDIVAEISPDARFVYVNRRIREVAGWDAAELIGSSFAERIHPDDLPDVLARFRQLVDLREPDPIRFRWRHKDGHWLWFESSGGVFTRADGRQSTVVVSRDVTRREEADAALRVVAAGVSGSDRSAFFGVLTESLARALGVDCAYVASLSSAFGGRAPASASPSFDTLACWCQGGLVEHVRFPASGTVGARALDEGLLFLADGAPQRFPGDALLRDLGGRSAVGAGLRDAAGQALGVLVGMHRGALPHPELAEPLLRIFAARAAAELERMRGEQARERLAQAVEQAAEAVLILDLEGGLEYANAAFERLAGSPRSDLLARPLGAGVGRQRTPELFAALERAIAKGGAVADRVTCHRGDGAEFTAELTLSPVRDAGGAVTHWVAVLRDISRELMLEAEVRQAQRLEAVGTLAGGIAHDFNNLLAGILGHASLLRDGQTSEAERREAAEVIETAARRAADLTQQLLGFAGRAQRRFERVDVHGTIQDLTRLLARTIPRNIEVSVRLAAPDANVLGDPSQIQQVLLNLALNARDAMPEGGSLVFETRRLPAADGGPGILEIAVRDTGVGIPDALRERIFEPFFTTKDTGDGWGMGLAVVYGIVNAHRGGVRVEGNAPQGTTFRISLPLAGPRARAQEREATPPGLVAPRGRGRILVADDEPAVRGLAERMLRRLGYEVAVAVDGVEAVEIFERDAGRFDLVILDLDMPRMGGAECFRTLRTRRPELRVLVSTGFGHPHVIDALLAEGLRGIVPKPYSLDQLARSVGDALRTEGPAGDATVDPTRASGPAPAGR
ncbi:MAG TPA: PAS domain S-box protein [Myxococcota bacterium]|nr:PAS domain S-box protein [Myxococcota bacterium]